MRPMFHRTDKRIEGHICLCYMAYTLQLYILSKLKRLPIPITEKTLREILDKMQVSLLRHNNGKVYSRSSPQPTKHNCSKYWAYASYRQYSPSGNFKIICKKNCSEPN